MAASQCSSSTKRRFPSWETDAAPLGLLIDQSSLPIYFELPAGFVEMGFRSPSVSGSDPVDEAALLRNTGVARTTPFIHL